MADTEMFEVRNRWTNRVQFTAEIICSPDATIGVKLGLAVRWAKRNDAVLRGAVLRGAVLRGAVLRGAALSDADLSDAVLRGADLSGAVLRGAVLRGADLSGADLSDAVLRGADLSDAVLRGADLSGAVLRDADLRGAVLSDADLSGADWIPRIANIHQSIYSAASAEGALDMSMWHQSGYCGTTHCRAGWAVVLAGEGGRVLEGVYGTGTAAALIYQASDPMLERIPNWITSNVDALEDMRAKAETEAAGAPNA